MNRVARIFGLAVEVANYRVVVRSTVLLFLLSVVFGHWVVTSIVKHEGMELSEALNHTVEVATLNLLQWNHHQQHIAKMWGDDPRLFALVEGHIAAHHRSGGDTHHQPIIDLLHSTVVEEGYHGFMVVTPDMQRIVSHAVHNGHGPLPENMVPYLKRALSGERYITPPIYPDFGDGFWPGDLPHDRPAQFVLSPVMDHQGRAVAVLVFHISPYRGWTEILSMARYNQSAETYLVDRNGILVSDSRFLDQMKVLGLAAPERGSLIGVRIELPPSADSGESVPFTHAASQVTRGEDGDHVTSPYRDYRGVGVVGAWRWIDELEVGIISEIDHEEGYRGIIGIERIFWIVVAALTLVGTVVMGYFFLNSRALEEREGRERLARETAEQEKVAVHNRATHDPLTGVPNQVLLEEVGGQLLKRASRNGYRLCLLFLDLDGFKQVNDLHGHQTGDRLLCMVAERLQKGIRESDLLSRWGGDEFVVLLDDCGSNEGVSKVANKLVAAVSAPYRINYLLLHVGLTIGISCYPEDGYQLGGLIRRSNIAMYHAKERCRGSHLFFHSGLAEESGSLPEEPEMVRRIQQAIDNDTLTLYWQKITSLPADSPSPWTAAEVLVRLPGDEGVRSLDNFMQIAERYGLISALDRWVFNNTLRWISSHRRQIEGMEFISINISAETLSSREFLADAIDWIEQFGIEPERLCFEITERTLLSNLIQATQAINMLQGVGCRFALDDFGTGISSFTYLKQLSLDFVKIDGSFVEGVVHAEEDRIIVQTINEIAHQLDIKTIAEHVSSEEILQRIAQMGVDYGQGYLFARPCPIGEESGYSSSPSS